MEALRGANHQVSGGGSHRAQKALVIAQAAASLVLLSVAAMLGDSLRNLEHQNFGFDPTGRYLVFIGSPMLANYKQEQLVPLYRKIQDRFSANSRSAQHQCRDLCPDERQPKRPRHSDSGQTGARPQGRCIRRLEPHHAPGSSRRSASP